MPDRFPRGDGSPREAPSRCIQPVDCVAQRFEMSLRYKDSDWQIEPRRSLLRSKHRLQLAGRRTDDLEHVSGGRLLLERFAQLAEQARVFDGNNGLRSKVCDKFNLFIRESPNFLTVNADCTDQHSFLEH